MPIPNPLPPGLVKRATEQFEKQRLDEEKRVKTFGDVRPIMYVPNFHGARLIAVREKIYQAPEKSTFTNFLFNHGLLTFGDEWLEAQNHLQLAEQHPCSFCTAKRMGL
jgi:hypothetical protein